MNFSGARRSLTAFREGRILPSIPPIPLPPPITTCSMKPSSARLPGTPFRAHALPEENENHRL